MDTPQLDSRLLNIDKLLSDKRRNVELKLIYARYAVVLIALPLLAFFNKMLPFPFPHLFIVCLILLFFNVVLHIISKGYDSRGVFAVSSPAIDAVFAAPVLFFSGGFLSPFIVLYIIVIVAISNVYPGRKQTLQIIFLTVLASYITVALLQKYGLLENDVLYSRQMMRNSIFFYFTLLWTVCIMGLCYYVLVSVNVQRNEIMNGLKSAYENIVRGMADEIGKDVLQRLVLHLAEALQTRSVFVGKLDRKEKNVIPETVWDGEFLTHFPTLPLDGSVFSVLLQKGKYFCPSDVCRLFPNDKFLTILNARSFYGITLYDKHGKKIGVICTTSDHTMVTDYIIRSVFKIFASRAASELERKKAEEESTLVHQQLAQAQKLEALGQLAGGIAHDFNNILSGIMGFGQLLQMKYAGDAMLIDYLEKIISLSKKASALTAQLLSFVRKGKSQSIPVDMHEVIGETATMLEHTIDKSISIQQELKAENAMVLGDPSQLENMLINLAVNARDAMPEGGALKLSTDTVELDEKVIAGRPAAANRSAGRYLVVQVIDSGKGMDETILEHIFEPFFTTKKKGKGTGLGLTAVHNCVESHDGFIEVSSQLHIGSTSTIYIPVHIPLAGKTGTVQQDTQIYIREIQGRGAHLLLIDDDIGVLESLKEALTLYGYNVKTCRNGLDAVEYFKHYCHNVDLVILDMNMPKLNGQQTFLQMKEIDPAIKVLIATGYAIERNVQEILAHHGSVEILRKPFRPDKLVRVIEKILSEPKKTAEI